MPAYKNEQKNTWYVSFYYTDWTGKRRKKKKEGLISKKEALAYEHDFLEKMAGQCTIRFNLLVQSYLKNCFKRVKKSTYTTKSTIIKKHILPYFDSMKINEIKAINISQWQMWMLRKNRAKTSQYLHYINVQLSCIFNFAKKYYGLSKNPVRQCEIIGNTKTRRRFFWTVDEFDAFIKNIDEKNPLYIIFNILFWTGIRRGEMLALRPMDVDFEREEIIIRRNLVYIKGKAQMNTPKTESSWRSISMPKFLLLMIKQYIAERKIKSEQILFKFMPNQIVKGIEIYSAKAGLTPIRIHDFRHSHASLLIEKGFSPIVVAERLGHRNINTTLRIYAHLYPNKQKKLAMELNRLYRQTKK